MSLASTRFPQLVFMGCIVCRLYYNVYTPPEVHHLRESQGMGQRADDDYTIPLCHVHHRTGNYGTALHAGIKAFESNYGTELELLEQTNDILEGLKNVTQLPQSTNFWNSG